MLLAASRNLLETVVEVPFRLAKAKTLKCVFPAVFPANRKFISMKNPKRINGCRCWPFNHCKVQLQLAPIYK